MSAQKILNSHYTHLWSKAKLGTKSGSPLYLQILEKKVSPVKATGADSTRVPQNTYPVHSISIDCIPVVSSFLAVRLNEQARQDDHTNRRFPYGKTSNSQLFWPHIFILFMTDLLAYKT